VRAPGRLACIRRLNSYLRTGNHLHVVHNVEREAKTGGLLERNHMAWSAVVRCGTSSPRNVIARVDRPMRVFGCKLLSGSSSTYTVQAEVCLSILAIILGLVNLAYGVQSVDAMPEDADIPVAGQASAAAIFGGLAGMVSGVGDIVSLAG
jgi:hypothetical protein